MSRLVLVRHGQASMFATDYDYLSPVGETQARCLGDYWVKHGQVFDAVYVGPRRRQQATARLVAEAFTQAGRAWPPPIILPELDEYNNEGILAELAPRLIEQDASIRRLAELARLHSTDPDRYRHYHAYFETVVRAWMTGRVEAPGVETWRQFHDRVRRGLIHIIREQQGGRRVVVFTSGGPIAVAAQLATQAPEPMALDLHWRLRNASLTEIVFSGERVTLDSFNTLPHLDDPALLTYR